MDIFNQVFLPFNTCYTDWILFYSFQVAETTGNRNDIFFIQMKNCKNLNKWLCPAFTLNTYYSVAHTGSEWSFDCWFEGFRGESKRKLENWVKNYWKIDECST